MLINARDVSSASDVGELGRLAAIFAEQVTTPDFPCIYSRVPFGGGDVWFGMARRDQNPGGGVLARLIHLREILEDRPDALGVIFIPDGTQRKITLDGDFVLAREIVRTIQADDPMPHARARVPDDPTWSLAVGGVDMFLNFSSPRHLARRSRNVGPAFTVIAQARDSFHRFDRASARARSTIRRRLARYDDVAAHPCLGQFGDPSNREALQYFLGDGLESWDATQ